VRFVDNICLKETLKTVKERWSDWSQFCKSTGDVCLILLKASMRGFGFFQSDFFKLGVVCALKNINMVFGKGKSKKSYSSKTLSRFGKLGGRPKKYNSPAERKRA